MKTTPKPRATKKSSGELVGPEPPPPPDWLVVAAGDAVVAVADVLPERMVEDMTAIVDGNDHKSSPKQPAGRPRGE